MKAYEFNTKISPDGKLEQPENLRHKLPPNQEVRVIILVNENSPTENTENQDGSRLAAEKFFVDYSKIDRQTFLQLPMEERHRILAQQVAAIEEHYRTDSEWQEWVNIDLGEVDEYES